MLHVCWVVARRRRPACCRKAVLKTDVRAKNDQCPRIVTPAMNHRPVGICLNSSESSPNDSRPLRCQRLCARDGYRPCAHALSYVWSSQSFLKCYQIPSSSLRERSNRQSVSTNCCCRTRTDHLVVFLLEPALSPSELVSVAMLILISRNWQKQLRLNASP